MFQNLRKGNSLYILHKNEPKLSVGEVKLVSPPIPQFGLPYQQGMMPQSSRYVEINITADGQDILMQRIPADLSITDYGPDMVISDNRDAIINEIEAFKHGSEKHIADTPRHERIVAECETMLTLLNPPSAKDTEQERRIEQLTGELSEMKAMLTEILGRGSKKEK